VHELALNPDNFTGRSDELILSTLVHEMCQVWQETHGEPSRRGYHNRQWAGKMREVGLQPTSTGEPSMEAAPLDRALFQDFEALIGDRGLSGA
jgi:predicted SprT family Zn-dependent metalloprotease